MPIVLCYILSTTAPNEIHADSILPKDDFAAIYANAVHGGLDKVLGHSGATAALYHTKMTNNLPDPAEFHKKLLALFGLQGTLSLERAIVKDLAMRLQWSLDLLNIEGSFDFDNTIHAVRVGANA